MNNTRITSLALTLLFTASSYVTIAQDKPKNREHKPPTFQELLTKMDTNKDGKLAKSEVKGPLLTDFDKVDLNKDGFLTEEEFKKAPKPKGGKPPRN